MAYNAALDTVYNHYLTSYASKSNTQYDTHKKSELRGVYNSIVKQYKESPLFILKNTKESQVYAINLKESSRDFHNLIASLGGLDEDTLLNHKSAFSSNSLVADAVFIGDEDSADEVPAFELEVHNLASPQENTGRYLLSSQSVSLESDTYSFDVAIQDLNYEFQFNINDGDTNKMVQERLSRLINNANIGIQAELLEDEAGKSSLRLTSSATGLPFGKTELFSITDDRTSKKSGAVDYIGLNNTSRTASNAEFKLNGELRHASSNHFTVEKLYKLTLNGTSEEGDITTINLKTDTESLAENISSFVNGYNHFIDSISNHLSENQDNRLLREMKSQSLYYADSLKELGLEFEDDGRIKSDNTFFYSDSFAENSDKYLETIKNFTNNALRKTNQISLDPMHYVDKKVVAYKNPHRNFANPYITSAYSGMMFNGYC